MQPMPPGERQALSSLPEDLFVELFAQVFGVDKVQLLAHEYPVEDVYGNGRFIDYALRKHPIRDPVFVAIRSLCLSTFGRDRTANGIPATPGFRAFYV